MKLRNVRVTNYRSIIDSEVFEIDETKTILVGPNEAGKTALLQAIQQLNPPAGIKPLHALRDYPRAQYNKISQGDIHPSDIPVVRATFDLEDDDKAKLPEYLQDARYVFIRNLDNSTSHMLENAPAKKRFRDLQDNLIRLAAHADQKGTTDEADDRSDDKLHTVDLSNITNEWQPYDVIENDKASALLEWINNVLPFIDEDNEKQMNRMNMIRYEIGIGDARNAAVRTLKERMPIFVLFSNYFRVRPIIHLAQLAARIANNTLDEDRFDYGNVCLLKLLGFDASELSAMGEVSDPNADDAEALENYREKLDERQYQLNAAEVHLTQEIRSVWKPDTSKGEDAKLRLRADGQYLKVTVEDDLGVEVELDQRSEGFQWLVSFFTVFFAEARGQYSNAVLLLDEPGLSLHGLKQRNFRETVSRLAEGNQTLYTTHSPFLVGPDELDRVRVIEMTDRDTGTKVRTSVTASDPAALLPLQETLGYDLAQSLFAQSRNLILEGLTDYWYLEAVSTMLRASGDVNLNEKIALVPANTAGKVVYFATILHAHKLKVAALLDSDNAGDQAAMQETLVHTLGNQRILRTGDFLNDQIMRAEIEDMLRESLVAIAKDELGWDISTTATEQPKRAIVSIFKNEISEFSKYRLAKAFLRWTREHEADDLSAVEREQWCKLIRVINARLK
ncbi:MAG: AAA family ATPase [Rhodospirillaceae bacterium]|nr:AAA family ATPase [Rhodospirillaceae bacterium]